MSNRAYCSYHSIYYSGDTCPRCSAEERHEQILEIARDTESAIREAAYERANPGEYECPHCKYLSLKRAASRCPLCQGQVERAYWDEVRAAEIAEADRRRAAAEARALEDARTAPARAAAALVARKKQFVETWSRYALVSPVYGYVIGGPGGCTGRWMFGDISEENFWYANSALVTLGPLCALVAPLLVVAVGVVCYSLAFSGD
jgi:hypothetical protein